MKNAQKFINTNSEITVVETETHFIASKTSAEGNVITVEARKDIMPSTYKEKLSPAFDLFGEGSIMCFKHKPEVSATKEELEETGKQSGKIDGLYNGPLNWALIESADQKTYARCALEEIYKAIHNH